MSNKIDHIDMIKQIVRTYGENHIYNYGNGMLHEDLYKPIDCCLCGKEMKTIHDTNCAFPLARLQSAKEAFQSHNKYRSCNKCEVDVLDARTELLGEENSEITYLTLVQSLERDDLKSMYETPEAQKRFAELGQDYFKTWLGKSEKVNLKECQ